MAFIKRSTITPVNAKVGKRMLKCSSCGKPFVSRFPTNLCQNCVPETILLNEDNLENEPDLDQE